MADKKTERLINLTLALLATKRFLKKHEIFRTVQGYEGEVASMERMFERDKSDLRELGIVIEVGDIDPLFEDEPGYRIFQQDYLLQVPELTPREMAIFSVAGNLWNDSILGPAAQSGLRKLESLGIPSGLDLSMQVQYRYEHPGQVISEIQEAIKNRKAISFEYESPHRRERKINPKKIILWRGFWYVLGEDHFDSKDKLFKLARIIGEVKLDKKNGTFEIDEEFDYSKILSNETGDHSKAEVAIRIGEAQVLRNLGKKIGSAGDEDLFEIPYSNEQDLFQKILWHGSSVRLCAPNDLVAKLKKRLQGAING